MPDVALRSRSLSTSLRTHPLTPGRTHSITSARRIRLGLAVADLDAALADGHRLVDVRDQRDRDLDGVVSGAVALDPAVAVARLTPGTSDSLRFAQATSRWVLVGTDGHDAEWLTWHLHAAGVVGARFLLGGARTLRSRTVLPVTESQRREVAAIVAH